jgi:hypothetical protein
LDGFLGCRYEDNIKMQHVTMLCVCVCVRVRERERENLCRLAEYMVQWRALCEHCIAPSGSVRGEQSLG